MAAYAPISLLVPQYVDGSGVPYSGAVLKAYLAGTSTNVAMATNSGGGTTFTSVALNSNGFPEHSGAIVIPHLNVNYKIALYATQAAADADSGAIFSIDNLMPVAVSNDFDLDDAVSSGVSNVITITHTTTGTPVAGIGTGMAFGTETATGNNETGMVLKSVSTDVTAGSEDFKYVLALMTAGAAASDVFEVTNLASLKFLKANPELLGGDTDGTFTFGANTTALGGAVKVYGDTHATKAGDIEILSNNSVVAHYDLSATKWTLTGTTVIGGLTYPTADGTASQVIKTNGSGVLSFTSLTSDVVRDARTSNTILGSADNGKLIDITSGTFSQTFDAAATLGNGWFVYVRNSGTGDITLNPDGSETIDGLTTFIMYPGECRLIQCTGTALFSVVLAAFYKSFASSGTFVKPPGYNYFAGLIWGGGSSGQRNNNASALSVGGGGGGCGDFKLLASAVGASETVTIGAGGAAVTTVANGNAGGTTSLGTLVLAYAASAFFNGGSVLNGVTVTTVANYEGGSASSTPAATFWGGGAASQDSSAAGAASWYGGASGGSLDATATVRAPGTSKFGGAGGAASSASNGTNGSQPGGGGGATQTGTQSGAGGDGELRIWGIA